MVISPIWNLLGDAVHSFVQTILEGGEIPEEAFKVLLVLIPNESYPSTMRSFQTD